LYIDKGPFCKALDISREEYSHILVLNDEAQVVWRSEGSCDIEKAENLSDFIKDAL
jgi:hypothetical protein